MALSLTNLDETTRKYMVEEVDAATRDANLYFSKRFNAAGEQAWPSLLMEAARSHDDHWLAYQLETRGLMKGLEGSRTPTGGYTIKHVPQTAAETMAEGQFNRYYILGVCSRAVAEGIPHVTVYRAKSVANPRPQSMQLIGTRRNPAELISQLRPVQSSLGHELLQPNSGLSVHL